MGSEKGDIGFNLLKHTIVIYWFISWVCKKQPQKTVQFY